MINGSLVKIDERLKALEMGVQSLADKVEASKQQVTDKMNSAEATVVATAEALARDTANRRQQAEMRFAPWQKVMAVAASFVGLSLFVLAVIQFLQK